MPRKRTAAESLLDVRGNPIKNECPECHKVFTATGSLTAHMRIHAGVKPYFCQFCRKEFSQSGSLMTHMRIHTNEKPHKCAICGKAFKQSGTLQTHVRTHTGVKPHKCDICGKGFTQGGALNAHKRIHSGERPYECPECKKTFVQSTALIEHRKIHSKERPHMCSVCFMGFVSKARLKVHMKIHENIKPYQCAICEMRFNHSSNCKRHMAIHASKGHCGPTYTVVVTPDQAGKPILGYREQTGKVGSLLKKEINEIVANPPATQKNLSKVVYVLDPTQNQLVQKDSVEAAIHSFLQQESTTAVSGDSEEASTPQLIQIDGEWYEIQNEEDEETLMVEEVVLEDIIPEVSCEIELLPEEDVKVKDEVTQEHNYRKRSPDEVVVASTLES